ncbi:MAG: peroxiredoxin [Planctomycetes bacterium]|nr:peroxiredoxin [Planctomycetota bacterium]MCB9935395.1 peroxiredoxin [Planctomycetota bacterium]
MVWIPGFGKYSPRLGNRVGDPAPDFTLVDQDGGEVTLSAELGHKPVVLVFYPMAGSPVCTRQMCSLREGWPELMSKAKVFGLSYDSVEALRRFKENEHLPFPLLSDPDKAVAKLYGVDGTFAAARVTFVIGIGGQIQAVIENVKAGDHAKQVLDAL